MSPECSAICSEDTRQLEACSQSTFRIVSIFPLNSAYRERLRDTEPRPLPRLLLRLRERLRLALRFALFG